MLSYNSKVTTHALGVLSSYPSIKEDKGLFISYFHLSRRLLKYLTGYHTAMNPTNITVKNITATSSG